MRERIGIIAAGLLFACLSNAAIAEFFVDFDTGHPFGPHHLDVGVETPIEISFATTFESDSIDEDAMLLIFFDFVSSDGAIAWDLDGPDDVQLTEDDGFVWSDAFGDPNFWWRSLDPTAAVPFGPTDPYFPYPGRVEIGTLFVTAQATGQFVLESNAVLNTEYFKFVQPEFKDGSESVTLTVVPEPGSVGYLLLVVLILSVRVDHSRRRFGWVDMWSGST